MDRALRLIGIACVGAGLALVAARFAMPQLFDDRVVAPWVLLSGLPMIGAGLVLARRHWHAPLATSLALAVALVPAAAGLAGAYATSAVAASVARVALEPLELPGFTLALPAGEVEASRERYAVGRHRRRLPGAQVDVRWASVAPMSSAELKRLVTDRAAPATLEQSFDLDLGGEPFFAGVFAGEARAGVTAVYCRDAGQLVWVTSAVARAPELPAFHRRISASLRCTAGVARAQREVLAPSFPLPGVGYVADTQPPMFAGVDGSVFVFHPALDDASRIFADEPGVLAQLVAVAGVEVAEASRQVSTAGGRDYASAVTADGATRITATAFYCAELGLSFIAQHQGPAEVDPARAVEALSKAACPRADAPLITVEQAFAGACDDGDGLACAKLARGIAAGAIDGSGREPSALLERACSLGVESACPAPQGDSP